jgi:hypothetical protein
MLLAYFLVCILNFELPLLFSPNPPAPQTIDFLYKKGWRGLKTAKGGHDSVEFGLNMLLERHINVTAESLHLIAEMEDYEGDTNKEGEFTGCQKKLTTMPVML